MDWVAKEALAACPDSGVSLQYGIPARGQLVGPAAERATRGSSALRLPILRTDKIVVLRSAAEGLVQFLLALKAACQRRGVVITTKTEEVMVAGAQQPQRARDVSWCWVSIGRWRWPPAPAAAVFGDTTLVVGATYAFMADTGYLLARCPSCTGKFNYPAFVHMPADMAFSSLGEEYAQFVVHDLGDGAIALGQGFYGFLSLCQYCERDGEFTGSVEVNDNIQCVSSENQPGAEWDDAWEPEATSGGKLRLRGANGNYLARCTDCYPEVDEMFMQNVGGSNVTDAAFANARLCTSEVSCATGEVPMGPWAEWEPLLIALPGAK